MTAWQQAVQQLLRLQAHVPISCRHAFVSLLGAYPYEARNCILNRIPTSTAISACE